MAEPWTSDQVKARALLVLGVMVDAMAAGQDMAVAGRNGVFPIL